MSAELRYMFSIKTSLPARWVGETPAGYRIDVEYRGGGSQPEISTKFDLLVKDWTAELTKAYAEKKLPDPLPADAKTLVEALRNAFGNDPARPWLGIEGRIVSGVDWALLRADGVIEFDGQFVLTDGPVPDPNAIGVLVNARTSGSVDLYPNSPRPLSLAHCVDKVKSIQSKQFVGIALATKFEAPRESEPWASKKYTRKTGQLKYIQLSRGQFVAKGKLISFATASAEIDLDVFCVEVAGPGVVP